MSLDLPVEMAEDAGRELGERQVVRSVGSHEDPGGGEAGEVVRFICGKNRIRRVGQESLCPGCWGHRRGAEQSMGPLCWTPSQPALPGMPSPENGPSWSLTSCFGRILGVGQGTTELEADILCNLGTHTRARTRATAGCV